MRPGRFALFAAFLAAAPLAVRAYEGRAAAGNLVIEVGPSTYRIARLEAEGANLASPDVVKLFDPKDTAPIDVRLARFSAARVTIPEIVGETKAGGLEQRLVYHDVTLEKIVGGRIGVLRAKSLEQTGQKAGGGRIEARYGPMTVKGVDMRQIAHILSAPRADEKEPLKVIEEEATIEGAMFKFAEVKAELSIGRVTANGVTARAFKDPLPLLLERLAAQTPESEAAVLDALASIEIASLELRDIALVGDAAAPGKNYALKIGRAALTKIAGAAVGETSVENFEMASADGGRLDLRRLLMRDLDARPAFGQGPRRYPFVAHTEIAGLDFDAPDPKAGEGRRVKFTLAAATQDLGEFREGLPAKAAIKLDRAVIDLAARGETAATAQFLALGYKEVELSARLDAQWREKEQEIVVSTASADAKNMGALKAAFTFGGARPELFSTNTDLAMLAAVGVTVTSADLTAENGEIIDRIVAGEAKRVGDSATKVRADYARDAGAAVTTLLGGESEKTRMVSAAIRKFIERPKRLHIRLAAPKGFGALEALTKQPGEILNALEIEASAE